jgi:hypothetical protein
VVRPDVYGRNVFINCPFSADYQPTFRAILFAVYACFYRPRCALEISDSGQNRLEKIQNIIGQCKFGIHDISFMTLDKNSGLPRFNMSFELGLFLAAKTFGTGRQKEKVALVLDHSGYRYQKALSDISGQDISFHKGKPEAAINVVRNWLDTCQGGKYSLHGGHHIWARYKAFNKELPSASKRLKLKKQQLTYSDICRSMESWLKDNI